MSDKKIPDIHVSICFDKDESKGESRLRWLMNRGKCEDQELIQVGD